LIEARSVDSYLTKIGLEMALGNVKQGRGAGSFSPMQLLFEFAATGATWAADRFFELFFAVRGLHCLCWSRGLKAFFGIGEVADVGIAAGAAQPELERFITFAGAGFRRLSPALRAMLRNYSAVDDRERVLSLLADSGIGEVTVYGSPPTGSGVASWNWGAAPFFFEYRTEPPHRRNAEKNGIAFNCPETPLSSRSASAGFLYRRFRLRSSFGIFGVFSLHTQRRIIYVM